MTDYDQMLHQHDRVLECVSRLQGLISPRDEAFPHGHRGAEIMRQLSTLRWELVEHFAVEERGGYFAELLEARPDLANRAGAIRGQHREILASLDEQLAPLPDATPEGMLASVCDLLRLIRRHEWEERALVTDAALQDLGVGD